MRGWTRLDNVNACMIPDDSSFVTTHVEPALTPCLTVVARQGRWLGDDKAYDGAVVHCIDVAAAPATDTDCAVAPPALAVPAAAS
ncbi:hypothetical protein HaLaN_06140 [Haematococcus lacustris]|uniref:Uncharacterized protein n=1 Tax=Haematococcus lacustris TaxID=44745 RepID=A0A699YKK2_HAELA|nr:hypothetical protein HaLaN_06140 [Haematococcus lacustris]